MTRPPSLFPVLIVNFIGALGFSIVMPFLVFLVIDFGGNAVVYGVVGATYSGFQFVGAPILGRWSDTVGRRKILLLSQAGTFIAWVLFFVACVVPITELATVDSSVTGQFVLTLPLLLLFLARAIDGLTGGNISVANAYASDVSTPETRSANFGRMGVSFNLGMVIGPALAGVLGATVYGELVPVLAAALISLVAIGVIYLRLPESNPRAISDHGHTRSCSKTMGQELRDSQLATQCPKKRRQRLIAEPAILYMMVIFFIIFLGFSLFYVSFPMHAATDLQWSSIEIGMFFMVLSGSLVVVEGPVLAWLSQHSSEPLRIAAGLFVLALAFASFTQVEGPVIYAVAIAFAVGNGVAWPSLSSFLANLVDDSVQGAVQGLSGSAGSLASIVGLISGGVVFERYGDLTFLVAASLIATGALLSLRLARLRKVPLTVDALPQGA